MEKKFREYRMFWASMAMLIFFMSFTLMCLLHKNMIQMIAGMIFSLIALSLLLLRYKMVLFDDAMIIYEWKIAAMLPSMIEYKDIKKIEKKSKHHLIIHHMHKSHVYVFCSDEFIESYNALKNNA